MLVGVPDGESGGDGSEDKVNGRGNRGGQIRHDAPDHPHRIGGGLVDRLLAGVASGGGGATADHQADKHDVEQGGYGENRALHPKGALGEARG